MSVVAEFVTAPTALLGQNALRTVPGATLTLDRPVPSEPRAFPFLWVRSDEPAPVLAALEDAPNVSGIEELAAVEWGRLVRVAWSADAAVVARLATIDPTILAATGSVECWEFQVRARNREELARFERVFDENDLAVEVKRVREFAALLERDTALTDDQREALVLAYRNGYFDQPREHTQEELGELLGISGRAVSNRLRRGTKNLVASSLVDPSPPDRPDSLY